jgi:uncharacterized repeat protein (TIGR03803 family)
MSKFNWGVKACGIFLLWAATAVALPAQTLTTLYSFCSRGGDQCPEGAAPEGTLVQGTDGNLYGTTSSGGVDTSCDNGSGCGTVFRITASGSLTMLHSFDVTDGAWPYAGLIQGTNGKFYGTTIEGGANSCLFDGCGTVFSMSLSGTLTTLYSFCSQVNCADGYEPVAALFQGTNGDFYGTTQYGGTIKCYYDNGCGTVFKITADGTRTTLKSFDYEDGAVPQSPLIQGSDGEYYGTTWGGGAHTQCDCGTVFKITSDGAYKLLHSFYSVDGSRPASGLAQGTDGNFYGTTEEGGGNGCYEGLGCGTIFKVTPSGNLTKLHSFCSQTNCTDGKDAYAGLVQGTDGNFYGTTFDGGATSNLYCAGEGWSGCGTIFRITPAGGMTTLYTFCPQAYSPNCGDGFGPRAGLVQDTDGNFYGTTQFGGDSRPCTYLTYRCGTVFRFSVGLGPFVKTLPIAGKVGVAVTILGTSLTGATSVTFNGTAAMFTVKSKSEIATTVPTGATTGTVQVVTPGGTLSSNVPFTVK